MLIIMHDQVSPSVPRLDRMKNEPLLAEHRFSTEFVVLDL